MVASSKLIEVTCFHCSKVVALQKENARTPYYCPNCK